VNAAVFRPCVHEYPATSPSGIATESNPVPINCARKLHFFITRKSSRAVRFLNHVLFFRIFPAPPARLPRLSDAILLAA